MLKQNPSYDTVEEHKLLWKFLKPNFGTIYVYLPDDFGNKK